MIDKKERIEHELIIYKSGASLLATVKYIKEFIGIGLKEAKWIVDTLPDRRKGNFDIDEENKIFNEFGLKIKLTKDSTVVKFMISIKSAEQFSRYLEQCGNKFTLSPLRAIREQKLGDILD